jgi:hypothetical protein
MGDRRLLAVSCVIWGVMRKDREMESNMSPKQNGRRFGAPKLLIIKVGTAGFEPICFPNYDPDGIATLVRGRRFSIPDRLPGS